MAPHRDALGRLVITHEEQKELPTYPAVVAEFTRRVRRNRAEEQASHSRCLEHLRLLQERAKRRRVIPDGG